MEERIGWSLGNKPVHINTRSSKKTTRPLMNKFSKRRQHKDQAVLRVLAIEHS